MASVRAANHHKVKETINTTSVEGDSDIDDTTIQKNCKDYSRMLALLDLIWSNVRGIESGLQPTQEQKATLKDALGNGKKHWVDMGLATLQPKWHLTFDGHLHEQVDKCGGLADKADDSIEKFHQDLMRLRDRCRGVMLLKKQQTSIRSEFCRNRALVTIDCLTCGGV